MKSFACLALGLALASIASASVTVTVDLLDAPSEGMLPPNGVACVDVLVDVSSGDSWTAGGIRVQTSPGVTLRYATDPNTQQITLTNPGTSNRHRTFFSEPRP